MLKDPYAVLRALLRAEAARNAPKPETKEARQAKPQPSPVSERQHG
ncbi:hypothetical protein ACFV0T_07310 [Streptomyces sp. NPDC059582]